MAITVTHPFVSAKADDVDATLVRPSNWNANHTITMATNKLLGRGTAAAGAVEEITLGTNLSFSGTTLNAAAAADGDKGDITVSGSGATWTIDANAVTYAKLQDTSAASVLIGRGAGSAGDPQEITLGTNLSMSGTTLNGTGGGLVLLSSLDAAGLTNADITGIGSTYDEYEVHFYNVRAAATSAWFTLRYSADGGTTFKSTNNYFFATMATNDNSTNTAAGNVSGGQINLTHSSNNMAFTNTAATHQGVLKLFSPSSTAIRKHVIYDLSGVTEGGSYMRYAGMGSFAGDTAIVNALRFYLAGSGTFASGTFRLYGLSKS